MLLKKTNRARDQFSVYVLEFYGELLSNLRMHQYSVNNCSVLCNGIPVTQDPGLNRVHLHSPG